MDDASQILVVDDDSGIRRTLREVLQLAGLRYTGFSLGSTALAALLSGRLRPRAIVLDLHLPDMSGLQLIRSLQGNGIRFPTLVISGLLEIPPPDLIARIGCQAYLEKPFTVQGFLDALASLAEADRQDARGSRSASLRSLEAFP